jgi:hypothetical protein
MGVSGLPMTAWAFETVGVTPSKVKGSAVTSNAVPMRSFFMESSSIVPLIVLKAMLTDDRLVLFDLAQLIYEPTLIIVAPIACRA